ncbi:TPA: hypothetical protein I8Z88_001005 [Legionella pneumophila]|nr:hypothetical protein [Legionella pneumophila]
MNYKLILPRGSNLVQEFTSIPHGVTSLDLNWNNLDSISTAELMQAFAKIPVSVTSLNLSGNYLGFKSNDELVQILATIPANVTSLNLSGNYLGNQNGAELARLLATIPISVTALDLSWNDLSSKSSSELAQVLAAIPAHLTSLDLSWNALYRNPGLTRSSAAILVGMTSLNLSWNFIGLKSCAEIAHIFSSIPNHVVSLNLCLNCLHELSLENIALLKDSLKHVQTIYLSYNIVKSMSKEQRQALGAVFPNIQKIILVDYYGKELHPSQSITIANLIRELSGKTDVPSLLNQCILFVKRHQTNIEDLNIPEELKESIQTCKPL